jgi:hypothetical protein
MYITCKDLTQFLNVIAGLVERGFTFDANADALTITLTGGF